MEESHPSKNNTTQGGHPTSYKYRVITTLIGVKEPQLPNYFRPFIIIYRGYNSIYNDQLRGPCTALPTKFRVPLRKTTSLSGVTLMLGAAACQIKDVVNKKAKDLTFSTVINCTLMLNVWPIYLHLGSFGGKCR